MNGRPDIIEVLDRVHTGEYCTTKEWDVQRIPGAMRRLLKKHGLEKTCDQANPVNFDYLPAVTEYGQFDGYGLPGKFPITDLALILFPSELKIDYWTLHKVIHTLDCGGKVKCATPSCRTAPGAANSTMRGTWRM